MSNKKLAVRYVKALVREVCKRADDPDCLEHASAAIGRRVERDPKIRGGAKWLASSFTLTSIHQEFVGEDYDPAELIRVIKQQGEQRLGRHFDRLWK